MNKCDWFELAITIPALILGFYILVQVRWWMPLVVIGATAVIFGYMKLIAHLFLPRR